MDFDMAIYDAGGTPQPARFTFKPSPLVSCLMVTRGDAGLCRQAIGAFQTQTYGHRELVVLSQRADAPVRGLVEALRDPSIRFVAGPQGSLGGLRNASVAAAKGELICQWDDDDLYDRRRIELMLSALTAAKADAACLARLTLWWPARRRLALSQARFWEGTILAVKDKLPAYPDLQAGEDTAVADILYRQSRLVALDAPGAYIYRVTGKNTWDDAHFEGLFSRATEDHSHDYDRRTKDWPLPA